MDFAYALRLLKDGRKVTRHSWRGRMHIEVRGRGTRIVDIVKVPKHGDIEGVGWVSQPSADDLFAEDWSEVVSGTKPA